MTAKEYDNRMESVLCRHSEIMKLLEHADWKDDSFIQVCALITQSHKNEAEYINLIHNQDLKNDISVPEFMKNRES